MIRLDWTLSGLGDSTRYRSGPKPRLGSMVNTLHGQHVMMISMGFSPPLSLASRALCHFVPDFNVNLVKLLVLANTCLFVPALSTFPPSRYLIFCFEMFSIPAHVCVFELELFRRRHPGFPAAIVRSDLGSVSLASYISEIFDVRYSCFAFSYCVCPKNDEKYCQKKPKI